MCVPAPQRGKDTNNPSHLTENHKHPPVAAAQPAEPGPNPARRGAEPTVYIAHPTHGAGTRPHRTQLKTAARKTTQNAGQCVCQPREGRGRNRQAPPPPKKKGGGRGKRHENSPQPPNRPPTPPQAAKPPPRRHRRQDPHRGTGGPPTQNRRHQASNSGPRGKGTPKRKKKKKGEPPAQPERKGMEGQGPQSLKKKTKEKTKAQKTHPDNPAKKGWAQPRPGPNTHAHTARRNRKRRGAYGAPTKRHTSQKQAETEVQRRTPQTADTRGTTPQTVPKHTHPRPQPGLAGLTKPTSNRQPDPNTNATQQ